VQSEVLQNLDINGWRRLAGEREGKGHPFLEVRAEKELWRQTWMNLRNKDIHIYIYMHTYDTVWYIFTGNQE
jgi:hypothetical protein